MTPSRAMEFDAAALASPMRAMSNTVCIRDISGEWKAVEKGVVQKLSEFGEIARLDASLAATLGTVLVTYFDVRCAQYVLVQMAPTAEPFQPATHDCRVVSVDLVKFYEKTGAAGGFQEYGEVANVAQFAGKALVEFYDLRSAQALLAAARTSARPASLDTLAMMSILPGASANWATLASLQPTRTANPFENVRLPDLPGGASPAASPQSARTFGEGGADSPLLSSEKGISHRPVRTKITTKDFQKFDINPDAILRGTDSRTTVMVRHLQGAGARKEFLSFLDKCGLGNRYSFFYMPCKEHRNVPAGFAFVNFASPHDVHTLHGAVSSGLWREVCGSSPTKSPAVSYARFQGHDELVEHFSLSAVLHEQDPERRPVFRPEVTKSAASVHDVSSVDSDRALELPSLPSGLSKEAPGLSTEAPAFVAAEPSRLDPQQPSMQLQAAVQDLLRRQARAKKTPEERGEHSEYYAAEAKGLSAEIDDAYSGRMTGA